MKKLYVLKHLFLVVPLILFLHSCKKDNVPVVVKDQSSTESLVNIAKSSLEKQSVAGNPMISSLKSIGLTPDWSDVKTRTNSKNKTVLAIPLEKTINSFSELNVIITNGVPNEVIKKYTVAEDKTILLEFYALNGKLLKTGRYNPATRKFFESKLLPNKVSLYENVKNGSRSNGNVLLLLSNNTVKMSSKDKAIAGINEPKKPTDTPDLGIPLDEVDIVTEGQKKPDVPDPLGPPSPDPNTVDSWPIEPTNEGGGYSEPTNPATDIIVDFKNFPCAQALAEKLPNLKNDIAKLLTDIFKKNDLVNMTFEARPSLIGKQTDGELVSSSGSNYVIGINPDVLTNSTKEYILATLYHEGLHAYFAEQKRVLGDVEFSRQFLGVNVNDGRLLAVQDETHMPMGYDKYIRGLKDAILSFNKNYGDDNAIALAQGGIIMLNSKATTINDQERDTRKPGFTGSKCK